MEKVMEVMDKDNAHKVNKVNNNVNKCIKELDNIMKNVKVTDRKMVNANREKIKEKVKMARDNVKAKDQEEDNGKIKVKVDKDNVETLNKEDKIVVNLLIFIVFFYL